MARRTRRGLLQRASALSILVLAGCSALADRSPSPTLSPEYDQFRRTPTYVSGDVGLRLPEEVPRVESPTNADLVVLHGNPAVDAEEVVTWLADERLVALLGDRAQQTWLTWTQSEAYRDAFGTQARSKSDPSPHLLVAAAIDTAVTTNRFSWPDLPSNSELVQSIEEALDDFATWTPE